MKQTLLLITIILTSCYSTVDEKLITTVNYIPVKTDTSIVVLPKPYLDNTIKIEVDSLIDEENKIYFIQNSQLHIDIIDTSYILRHIEVYGQDWKLFRLSFTENRCTLWAVDKCFIDSIQITIRKK